MNSTVTNRAAGGLLLLLCGWLLAWQPLSTALLAAGMLGSLGMRRLPVVLILLVRVLITAIGVGAGVALLGGRPAAVAMTRLALIASAVGDLLVYLTPFFPSNRAPGETPIYVAVSLAFFAAWLLYLSRSARVRRSAAFDDTPAALLSAPRDPSPPARDR
jgi:hypothetical protein